MIKSYVIDTNILIQAPYACQCFEENRVILPLVVLEELDGLKKAEGEKGANARRAIRFLEKLRLKGDLLKGVQMENGGILRVEANCVNVELPESLPEDKPDNRILKVCKGIREEEKPVVLVTKDLVLRLKAQILGIEAQDFSTEQVIEEEGQYSGRQICYVAEDKFKEFKKKGVHLKELYLSDEDGNKIQPELTENEFIILKADQSVKKTHLGRVEGKKVVSLEFRKSQPYGIKPRNAGQYFLQEALMKSAEKAPLVIVKGMAGTAKTFYSLAVGLEKVLNNPTGEYRRILICRPNAQFDQDIGFLPGDAQEKVAPYMQPLFDNLNVIKRQFATNSTEVKRIEDMQKSEQLVIEALAFIRGRSLSEMYCIIDEAQNLTPNEIKTIITRAGEGTKMVFTGDIQQIDQPYLDSQSNGLVYMIDRMKDQNIFAHVNLLKGERSELSELASNLL